MYRKPQGKQRKRRAMLFRLLNLSEKESCIDPRRHQNNVLLGVLLQEFSIYCPADVDGAGALSDSNRSRLVRYSLVQYC